MIILSCLIFSTGLAGDFETIKMNSTNQFLRKLVQLKDDEYTPTSCFTYGLWSKYNPLSSIKQVGLFGIFDGHCFHLHNAIEQGSQSLNFIYYDCLDSVKKQITKTILFINNKDEQNRFEIKIDSLEYENIWFYLLIQTWPSQDQLKLTLIKREEIQFEIIKQMKYPFKDLNLIFTFGGNLIVHNSKILDIQIGQIFSYFPGPIILQELSIQILSLDFPFIEIANQAYEQFKQCFCEPNQKSLIGDYDLQKQDSNLFISENSNCDQFLLVGWIKIKEIVNITQEFTYQIIKITANIQYPISQNQNLSPFQLYYHISPKEQYIEITTYSYTFPDITIDFTDDPFLLLKQFLVLNEITLWHYLTVQLLDNELSVGIKFYGDQEIYNYDAKFEVNQFHNCQLKVQYGNCLQAEFNYMNIQLRNLEYFNCYQELPKISCHYSCLECDGPTAQDCLSCQPESQRIYLREYKTCICPFNTVDYRNSCQTYKQSNFRLIEDDNLNFDLKCQYGFFEIDGDCFRCPSMIKNDLITCNECLSQPKSWFEYPTCSSVLLIKPNATLDDVFIPFGYVQYYFDGTQLSSIHYTNSFQIETNISSTKGIFKEFQLAENHFRQFCQQLDKQESDQFIYYECFIENCQICYLSLTSFLCAKCLDDFLLVNGQCTFKYDIVIGSDVICLPPFYFSFEKRCKICEIQDCIYCFEYSANDLYLCSLNQVTEFDLIWITNVKVGCALCEENFIFDFTLGLCLQQNPKLNNCLRSYIDLGSQEQCISSKNDDFSIAPEISNCQKYIQNCEQCSLNIKKQIICIACQKDFTIQNENCYQNEEFDTTNNLIYNQNNKIQSFILSFIPELKLTIYKQFLNQQQITDGTCDPECILCDQTQLYCKQCPLNYYKKPIITEKSKSCSYCHPFCQVCSTRSDKDIENNFPNFIVNDENQFYLKQCVKPYEDPAFFYDPYLQIVRYCFNQDCKDKFVFDITYNSCDFTRLNRFYEQSINTQYCNQIGVTNLAINFTFDTFYTECFLFLPLNITTQLKQKILTLKKVELQLSSLRQLSISSFISCLFNNFDLVEIKYIRFLIDNGQSFVFSNKNNKIDLILTDFTIEQSIIQNTDSVFIAEVFGNIILNNLTIIDTTLINSSIFNFQQYQVLGSITINNLYLKNCKLIQSTIFKSSKIGSKIAFVNFTMEESFLTNSSIFSLFRGESQQRFLNGSGIVVRKCDFINSYLINSTDQIDVSLNNIFFYLNSLDSSVIISVSYKILINQINIYDNIIVNSQFLSITQILFKSQIICQIQNFDAQINQFQASNLVLIFSTFSTNFLIIQFTNFSIINNYKYSKFDENIFLFNMNSQEIYIANFKIIDNDDLMIFYLSENKIISISNIKYQNSIQNFIIPLSSNCLTTNKKNKFLQIFGFQTVNMKNVEVLKILSVDEPIIQINPSNQNLSLITNQINIINFKFAQNILVQSTLANLFSILVIKSEKTVNMLLKNILFDENYIHSYTSSAARIIAGLLYIESSLSYVQIQNFLSKNNSFTNSSSSFIFITSSSLKLSNYSIMNHNFLSQQLWTKYYKVEFDKNLDEDNLNEVIFEILQIKNIGGAGQFSIQNIECYNCTFQKILAMQSFIFDITTIEGGLINFLNVSINQAENNLLSTEKSLGCFSIYSSNSELNLKLQNASLSNIFNRMAPSIFTIYPSKSQNIILLKDIIILNCISLVNQIINIQFSSSLAQKNIIKILNMKIIQNYDALVYYFDKVRDVSIQEITDTMNSQNSMISFQNCLVVIQEFVIQGLIMNSIFQFTNLPKLQLINIKLDKVQMLYSFNLISVNQLQNIQSLIQFEHINVKNISVYKNESLTYSIEQRIDIYNIRGCKMVLNNIERQQQDFFISILFSLQQNNDKQSSLVYIKTISNQNGIYMKDLAFEYNNCQSCSNGIIFFEILDFKYVKLQNLVCNNNFIVKFGCLHFSQETQLKQQIYIENSNFISNNGSQGVGIWAYNSNIQIKNCKIIYNNAKIQGGGLYLKIESSNFLIKKSIIINNQAQIGGGIYLDGDCNLENNKFVESILLFNYASDYGNNIIEIPTHSALFINQVEHPSTSYIFNTTSINVLQLKPYRIIEQGVSIIVQDLLFPSNQILKSFQIYDIRKSNYKSFIQDINLQYKNSRNEIMFNFINSSCKVQDKIITKSNQELSNQTAVQYMLFDNLKNSFDFGSLSFSLDPFQQNYKHLQIDISCQLKESKTKLYYRINGRSLKCQLGEFYVDNGCQICQSNQGYYSVTYNATKCSIFDKSKYSDITSNMIKMLPGFWRPNNLSDYVESCFKNTEFCKGGWSVGDQTCQLGHLGALCEECDINDINGQGYYFKNQWDQNCLKCQFEWSSLFASFFVCLWTFISISMSIKSISKSNQLYAQLLIAQRFSKILFKLNQDHGGIQLKMFINYIWIFSIIFTFNIKFQFSLLFIEQTSDTSYFIARDLDCYISSIEQIPILYLKIFTMIILMIMLFNITFIGSYLHFQLNRQKYDLSLLSNVALYLYLFNYAGLIKMFSSVLSKREVSNDDYIQGDVSLKYGTQNHKLWMFYFIIPGLFIIGALIPITIFVILTVNKNRLDQIKLRRHICYLLNEYKQERYYWELIKLLKKSIIIYIMTNFETDIVLKASLSGLCLLIYEILAIFHSPYIIQKFNQLDLQSGHICSISIFLATTKYICEQKEQLSISMLLQIFIILCFIQLSYSFIFEFATSFFKKYQFFFLNKLYLLLHLKVPNLFFTKILKRMIEKEKQRTKKLNENFSKLRNYLIFCSKVQLRNSRSIVNLQSSRLLTSKSSRVGLEKLFFSRIEEDEFNRR